MMSRRRLSRGWRAPPPNPRRVATPTAPHRHRGRVGRSLLTSFIRTSLVPFRAAVGVVVHRGPTRPTGFAPHANSEAAMACRLDPSAAHRRAPSSTEVQFARQLVSREVAGYTIIAIQLEKHSMSIMPNTQHTRLRQVCTQAASGLRSC
ncbi:hypothetical protein LZ31DRAFT_148431 [Colletotrichum somersetense]|nr:hypothetical protein LZ31DRAFT_148431 [Colletotrichum somersetense]